MMHSQGDPQDMQKDPRYEDVVEDVMQFFRRQIKKARKAELDNIILDPGIGFGKTLKHNLRLLEELHAFTELGYPVMVGASRKSMFDQILAGRPAKGRVTATVAAHYDAMLQGARILRVHDVQEACDSVRIFEAIHLREQSI
jgi:dihydropteroate synthase